MLRNGESQCRKLITLHRKTWEKLVREDKNTTTREHGVLFLNLETRKRSERGGPGKIRVYWENKVHVVKERRGTNGPVYVVKPLDGDGRERTLHRNLLLPCPYLVDVQGTKHRNEDKKRERKITQKPKAKAQVQDSESSSDEEYTTWMPRQSQNM